MRIASLEDASKELIRIIGAWESESIETPWYVQDEAGRIEQELQERGLLQSGAEPASVAAIIEAALDVLAIAQAQYVLPADIPAFRALLSATPGTEPAALEAFEQYWNSVDFKSREQEVQRYWFGPAA